MMKNKKKNSIPILVVPFVLFLLLILVVLVVVKQHFGYGKTYMDRYEYFGMQEDDDTCSIILNQTVEEEKGQVINGEPYAACNMISDKLSAAFYWDSESGAVLHTTESGTLYLYPDDPDVTVSSGAPAVTLNDSGEAMIALEYAAEDRNAGYAYYENPARVVLTTVSGDVEQVTVTKDTQVRYRAGIKSEILEDVEVGDTLYYLGSLDDWQQVACEDGLIGYVPAKNVSDLDTVTVDHSASRDFTMFHTDEKINLVWHQTDSAASNALFSDITASMTGVNVISPTWFSVTDNTGTLWTNCSADYVSKAHKTGLQVWGLIDNFNTDFDTETALESASARRMIIDQLIGEAIAGGLDGINVDFEDLSEGSIPHYLQFLRELTFDAHQNNLIVSVDTSVPQVYTAYYQRQAQGQIVDYMIMMGYDEHYSGSETAGSVASLPFVEDGILELLSEGIPCDSIICAVPLYTRLWQESLSTGEVTSEVLPMYQTDERLAELGMEYSWDDSVSQNVAELETSTTRYSIWIEDEESLTKKAELITDYQLAGIAAWKLGFETETVWTILSDAVS